MIKEKLANKRLEKRINTSKLKKHCQLNSNCQVHKDQNLPTISRFCLEKKLHKIPRMTSEQDNLPTCVRIESMNLVKKKLGVFKYF